MTTNADLIDPDQNLFKVLGFLYVQLSFPNLMHVRDINCEEAKGAIFTIIDDTAESIISLADFTVADVSEDQYEPDVSTLLDDDIGAFNHQLCEATTDGLESDGNEMVRWMNTYLTHADGERALMTAYVARVDDEDRQYVVSRLKFSGHKIVLMGSCLVRLADELLPRLIETMARVRVVKYDS